MFGRTKSVNSILKGINKQIDQLKKLSTTLEKKSLKTTQKAEKLFVKVGEINGEKDRAKTIANNFLNLIGEKPEETPLTEPAESA